MKEVFEEVKLGFLVVGHTHEDIDGCFRYLSKKNLNILLHLSKSLPPQNSILVEGF
jgi:hypothetical protein